MTNPLQTLQKLGLSEKDAKVYLALLKLGHGSANAIARNAGLKRPTTYVVLEGLRARGLVLKMPGAKRQMFAARSPEEFIAEIKKDVAEAEVLVPDLMNTYSSNTPRVRTIHFEGLAGVREALWYRLDTLKEKEIKAFFGSAENANPELVELFHEWNAALAKQKTRIRSIAPDSATLKKFRENDALYGFLSKTLSRSVYTSETSIDIADTFIRILMFKELQAVIIENATVAKALREIFEICWRADADNTKK
jgi:sugar-specific transcriptional regulator TrmB